MTSKKTINLIKIGSKVALRVTVIFFALGFGALHAAPQTAAEKPNKRVTAIKPTAAPVASASGGKAKVLRFDSLTITGEAAKPQVFYLLNRKKILVRHEPEKRDLLKDLEKTVEGDPF